MHIREHEASFMSCLRAMGIGLLCLAFWPAQPAASQLASCGTDLLAGLGQTDPEKLRQIRTEADAVPNGKGLLWKIQAAERAPSYLFGTMHMSDERVVSLAPEVREALDAAGTLVIETTDVLDRAIVGRAMAARPDLTTFPAGETLADHLTAAQQEDITSWLQERDVNFETIARMKPWMVLSLASQPACERARQTQGQKILDLVLAEEAKATGKRIVGLETLIEQFEALDSFAIDVQVQSLMSAVELGAIADDVLETMLNLYVDGETAMFLPALLHVTPHDPGELDEYASFEQRVVLMRNRVMAERALPYLKEGGAFIAIGALHLPGKEGVIELLRAEGLAVERVE